MSSSLNTKPKLSKLEQEAENIENDRSYSIKKQYWGSDKINGCLFSKIGEFFMLEKDEESPQIWQNVLMGQSSKSPEEIFIEHYDIYEKHFQKINDEYDDKLYFGICKEIMPNLTMADKVQIEDSYHPQKMLKLLLNKKGVTISNNTMLVGRASTKTTSPSDLELPFLEEIASKTGYVLKKINCGWGWGSSLSKDQELDLFYMDGFAFDIYFGEVALSPHHYKNTLKEAESHQNWLKAMRTKSQSE